MSEETKDRYAAGVADATKDIADWLRSGVAASLFGSETWALRRALAKRIEDETWKTIKDDRVLLRVESNATPPEPPGRVLPPNAKHCPPNATCLACDRLGYHLEPTPTGSEGPAR